MNLHVAKFDHTVKRHFLNVLQGGVKLVSDAIETDAMLQEPTLFRHWAFHQGIEVTSMSFQLLLQSP